MSFQLFRVIRPRRLGPLCVDLPILDVVPLRQWFDLDSLGRPFWVRHFGDGPQSRPRCIVLGPRFERRTRLHRLIAIIDVEAIVIETSRGGATQRSQTRGRSLIDDPECSRLRGSGPARSSPTLRGMEVLLLGPIVVSPSRKTSASERSR